MTWMRTWGRGDGNKIALDFPPQKPENDPVRLAQVRVKVVKPFMVDGHRVEVGTVITVKRYEAHGLVAAKKVAWIED
jgi:hypothetical protein